MLGDKRKALMEKVVLKTRIKNTSGQGLLLRWIAPRGQFLKEDEELIVDGSYPTAVPNRRFVSSCEYDIVSGRVEVEVITNLPTRKPTAKEMATVMAVHIPTPAVVPSAEAPKVELTEQEKVDERWQKGTAEGAKPKPMTLPGHEDALAAAENFANPAAVNADGQPQTLEIFPEGTGLGEDEKAADEATQAAQAPAEEPPAPAEEPPAPAEETPAPAEETPAPAEEPPKAEAPKVEKPAKSKKKGTSRRKTAKPA
jgi:hypothetical protein